MVAGPRTQDFTQQQTIIVNPARLHLTVEIEGTTARAGPTTVQLEYTQQDSSNSSSEISSSSGSISNTSTTTGDSVEDTSRYQVVIGPQEESDSESNSSINSNSESSEKRTARERLTRKRQKEEFEERAYHERPTFPYLNSISDTDEGEEERIDVENHRACRRQKERDEMRARCMEAAIERERSRENYSRREMESIWEAEKEAVVTSEA